MMKKPYEEPRIIIELFLDADVIVCSIGDDYEDPDDPIFGNRAGSDDA